MRYQEPACRHPLGHKWHPASDVADRKLSWLNRASIVATDICLHCGAYRIEDGWLPQGYDYVYLPAAEGTRRLG